MPGPQPFSARHHRPEHSRDGNEAESWPETNQAPELDEDGEAQAVHGLVETTVGRALLSEIIPEGLTFDLVNRDMSKKAISNLINA